MSALIVDTSSWSHYFKGEAYPEIDEGLKQGLIYLPVIVSAELTSGQISPVMRAALTDFLMELPLVDASLSHWLRVGELRHRAAEKGLNISMPDAHVAQCGIDLGGRLISEDRIFKTLKDAIPSLDFRLRDFR